MDLRLRGHPWRLLKARLSVTKPSSVLCQPEFDDPATPLAESALHSSLAPPQPGIAIDLRLIATSDLHASLLPYDYCANRAVSGRSLSEISRQIATARVQVPNSLLFDNGDFLQGTPLADFVASRSRRRRAHPVIAAFNTLGYDAVTLGNHEFNYGVPFLTSALTDARFPVVSANIVTRLGKGPLRDQTFVPPYAILKRKVVDRAGRTHSLKIGVIGFAPPQIEIWDRDQVQGQIRMRDIIAAARAWLPRLRARGADVIVALAHTGIGSVEVEDGMENAAAALAGLPEVDAVIAGHCHQAFPGLGIPAAPGVDPKLGLLAGKPAVMPGHSGSHLGVIDLVLTSHPTGPRRWQVASGSARLGVAGGQAIATAPLLRKAIGPDHRAALAWSRQVLGETRVALHTHFATVAPCAATDFTAGLKADHVRAALAGTGWADLPVLASAAPFRSGGRGGANSFTDVGPGVVRMRNVSELYLFPNSLVGVALTGAQLADWLERSASIFRQVLPGDQDVPLHDDRVPGFAFEAIPGVSYAIDLTQPSRFDPRGRMINPEARRIVGLAYSGARIDPDQRFILATNNHRFNVETLAGGAKMSEPVYRSGLRMQALIAEQIRLRGVIGQAAQRNWHFLPMPGTTVRLQAGVGSERHVGDIGSFRAQFLGADSTGFTHYRLHL
jgi:2',3'-cyclic-nucleotide 2'-phosphodiesterase/3'-nucleotidase